MGFPSERILTQITTAITTHYAAHGTAPTSRDLADAVGCHNSTATRSWAYLAHSGTIPAHILASKSKIHGGRRTPGQSAPPTIPTHRANHAMCTAETANAICDLLQADPHARALFKCLLAGIRPGRGQGNHKNDTSKERT